MVSQDAMTKDEQMLTTHEIRHELKLAIEDPSFLTNSSQANRHTMASPIRSVLADVEAYLPDITWDADTFGETAQIWLEERTDLKDKTRDSYNRVFAAFTERLRAHHG